MRETAILILLGKESTRHIDMLSEYPAWASPVKWKR